MGSCFFKPTVENSDEQLKYDDQCPKCKNRLIVASQSTGYENWTFCYKCNVVFLATYDDSKKSYF